LVNIQVCWALAAITGRCTWPRTLKIPSPLRRRLCSNLGWECLWTAAKVLHLPEHRERHRISSQPLVIQSNRAQVECSDFVATLAQHWRNRPLLNCLAPARHPCQPNLERTEDIWLGDEPSLGLQEVAMPRPGVRICADSLLSSRGPCESSFVRGFVC
jgi:hypothetical protein